jgi:hypothetical protein
VSGILFSLILLLQGIPVQQGGTVTGVLRDSKGLPAAGVRMAAVTRSDVIENSAAGSMAGITETDAQGRFTLENIPPGRYAIAAGRLDLQTYYPGTQVLADATVLTIARGSTLAKIDFVLNDASFGRSSNGTFSGTVVLSGLASLATVAAIPVTVRVENGGKLPVTANGKEITIMLSSTSNQFSYPVQATAISVPGPLSGDFSVKVDGLPSPYRLKSITYGATDITSSTFPLTAVNFSTPSTTTAITFNGTLPAVTTILAFASPAAVPPSALTIALDYVLPATPSGVRVTGTTGYGDKPNVYISGVPGIVYSDSTFEFRDVPPGRHLIAAVHRFTPRAALVVVGDRDIDGVALRPTLAQPDTSVPQAIPPASPYMPGTVIPLPRILGTAVDEKTGMPIVKGTVTVENDDYKRTFSLDSGGRFESFSVFPGDYTVSLWVLGHVSSTTKVTIAEKDVQVRLVVPSED